MTCGKKKRKPVKLKAKQSQKTRKKKKSGGSEDDRQRKKYKRGGRIEAYTFGEALGSKNWP